MACIATRCLEYISADDNGGLHCIHRKKACGLSHSLRLVYRMDICRMYIKSTKYATRFTKICNACRAFVQFLYVLPSTAIYFFKSEAMEDQMHVMDNRMAHLVFLMGI